MTAEAPQGEALNAPSALALGGYQLVRELGRGGMGIVYEAVEPQLGRHVALKVLPSQAFLDTRLKERFRREAQAAAKLQHPHIVPIYGMGEDGGIHYYAMQLVSGRGLDRVLQQVRHLRESARGGTEAPPTDDELTTSIAIELLGGSSHGSGKAAAGDGASPPRPAGPAPDTQGSTTRHGGGSFAAYCRGVARLGADVSGALSYAHAEGVLHRDVKPSNILLDHRGHAWVADFGLAKTEGAEDLTRSGEILGTLRYMAPEQLRGWSDPRSDVYSLGATLYEMLALRTTTKHLAGGLRAAGLWFHHRTGADHGAPRPGAAARGEDRRSRKGTRSTAPVPLRRHGDRVAARHARGPGPGARGLSRS
jgi:serine/threonine protein kinase